MAFLPSCPFFTITRNPFERLHCDSVLEICSFNSRAPEPLLPFTSSLQMTRNPLGICHPRISLRWALSSLFLKAWPRDKKKVEIKHLLGGCSHTDEVTGCRHWPSISLFAERVLGIYGYCSGREQKMSFIKST